MSATGAGPRRLRSAIPYPCPLVVVFLLLEADPRGMRWFIAGRHRTRSDYQRVVDRRSARRGRSGCDRNPVGGAHRGFIGVALPSPKLDRRAAQGPLMEHCPVSGAP